ncbi:zinc finger protein 100-like isoform X1 [Hylaeus anthracinus]|uniref:zinc finger protein 100-like isoform X1 n=1 Tax=Hylaeus anthracinus TaxID=313031 RepID=UPI0023BA0986|nr:zinc finger protein 100-like isoform X1 [Hylaeus anthracinus]
MSNLFCLVCNINLDVSSCVNIFCTSLPRNEEVLADFISKVLLIAVNELHDSYICLQCYNLFQMLEQAQKTVSNIRYEILKIYHATERRKIIKQTVNNDANLNLNTTVVLEDNKLNINNSDECLKGGSSLQGLQIEEMVEQQYIKDKVIRQISLPNINCDISAKTIAESKKDFKRRVMIHDSIALTDETNPYTINSAQTNMHTLKMPIEDNNDIFSNNKPHIQNITRLIDFKWKEVDENVTKENTENTTASKIDEVDVSMKSGKVSKCNLKPLKYSCSTCGKRWKTSAELKTHIKSHSTLKPYMCEKCGQAYKHKHALEIHVGMHNGINPFQCNFCNKCFTQKGALMRHLPMHTGEMPYQCEVCGKRFIHHTSYNMHRLSHSGKKSYKCSKIPCILQMCDLSLLSTSHLKRHMRVHTGEKAYSCTLCGRRFAERYNLLAHQKIHDLYENKPKKTTETQYKCNRCNLVFEQKQNLNDHAKYHSDAYSVQSETNELPKKINHEHDTLQQTWIQMNRSKLDVIDTQTKFVLLQNPLPEIDEDSFAVTFNDQKISEESTNYNTSLQVIIQASDTSSLSSNLPPIDKTHM